MRPSFRSRRELPEPQPGRQGGIRVPVLDRVLEQAGVATEFEGVATLFKLDEDLWRIQPAIKDDVLLRWTIPPIPSVFAGDVGFFARAALSPNYFYVPVRGIIEGDEIKFLVVRHADLFTATGDRALRGGDRRGCRQQAAENEKGARSGRPIRRSRPAAPGRRAQ